MKPAQIWAERRKIILLSLLVLLLAILLAQQERLIPSSPVGRVVRASVHPLVVAVAAVDRFVAQGWTVLFHSRDLMRETQELKGELAEWRARYNQLADAHAQLEQLSKLKAWQPTFNQPNVVANVVAFSPNFWKRTVTVDRGRRDGIRPNMPVVNQEGLVGVVREVSENNAVVQLIADPDFAAGALVRETRDRGVVEGSGDMDRLLLVLDNPQARVEKDLKVLTSGQPAESLFPKGLLIGTIEAATTQSRFGQTCAVVKPAARFYPLEAVVVLLETRSSGPSEQLPGVPPPAP
ncbi:rod shape-determining protein MreC [Candidatus Sumerlaeota bacterium]|nr:rod shape-determining protein MreC [Candidatus Sumerlaeota bacterium]